LTEPRPYTPREYQVLARRWILDRPRCNLWAVPGMGKTSVTFSAMDILQIVGSNFFPALIIAPLKVCQLTWPAEQKKWLDFAGLRVVPILGEADVRDDALMTKGDVYVINYDNVVWLTERLKRKQWPFKIVVADESTRLKSFRGYYTTHPESGKPFFNSGGKSGVRSAALAAIAEHTRRWVNLTGTPATNGLTDLWGQNWFVDFGERLGRTYGEFMKKWFTQNPYTRVIELRHPSCEPEIYLALADVSLALRAEDWFDIQAPLVFRREVELPPEARKLYDQMERDFFIELGERQVTAVNAAVLSSKLLQIASGAVYSGQGPTRTTNWLHDAKIEELRSIVNELGEPLLVSYWFKFEEQLLKKAFPNMRIFRGSEEEELWNKGKIPLMAVHPQSGGHGTNLQYGGRAMVHFSHTWNLELKLQVNERIGPTRQLQAGFNRNVLQYEICARNTMDEEVLARQQTKWTILEALMNARAVRG
jgi:SNF2 family DNA or RNA helicase